MFDVLFAGFPLLYCTVKSLYATLLHSLLSPSICTWWNIRDTLLILTYNQGNSCFSTVTSQQNAAYVTKTNREKSWRSCFSVDVSGCVIIQVLFVQGRMSLEVWSASEYPNPGSAAQTEVGGLLERRALINHIGSGYVSLMSEVKRDQEVRGWRDGEIETPCSSSFTSFASLQRVSCHSYLRGVGVTKWVSLHRVIGEQMEHQRALCNRCCDIDDPANIKRSKAVRSFFTLINL